MTEPAPPSPGTAEVPPRLRWIRLVPLGIFLAAFVGWGSDIGGAARHIRYANICANFGWLR